MEKQERATNPTITKMTIVTPVNYGQPNVIRDSSDLTVLLRGEGFNKGRPILSSGPRRARQNVVN
jgi:hypothetical protein